MTEWRAKFRLRTLFLAMVAVSVLLALSVYLSQPFWGGRAVRTSLVECRSTPRGLYLENLSDEEVCYAVVNPRSRSTWCPMSFGSWRNRIPPHETIHLTSDRVFGCRWRCDVDLMTWTLLDENRPNLEKTVQNMEKATFAP
jgi:hypothetical protein